MHILIQMFQMFDNAVINLIFTSAHSAVYSRIASYLSFSTVKFLPIVLVICWYWSKKTPQQALNRQILVEAVFSSLLAIFVGRLLALTLPFRERPFLNPELNTNFSDPQMLRTWSSFPSDHAVLSFALAASLFRISPTIGILAFLHASILICLPRVVLGWHYPSDIIGGAIVGILIVIISAKIKAREKLVKFILDIESKSAEIFYVFAFILLYEIIEMFDSIRGIVAKTFALLQHIAA